MSSAAEATAAAQQQQQQQQQQQPPQQYDPEAKEARVRETLGELFARLGEYMSSELAQTDGDFAALQALNDAAARKYEGMAASAARLGTFVEGLQESYRALEPYLVRIDEVDRGLADLEQTILALDEYTKKLEARFRRVVRTLK